MKMKTALFALCLSLLFSIGFAQNTQLFDAIEFAVLKRNVKIMKWENEYTPDNDIRSWTTQKQECVEAWGVDSPNGKLIAAASMEEYQAIANQIRGDLMKTKYNFAGNLKKVANSPANWSYMKRAYNNACFNVIRKMYKNTIKNGHMNAAGNWLIASEMMKLSKTKDGTALAPLKDGCLCDADTLATLQRLTRGRRPAFATQKQLRESSREDDSDLAPVTTAPSSGSVDPPVENTSVLYLCDRGNDRNSNVVMSLNNNSDWIVRFRFIGGYDAYTKKNQTSSWYTINPKKSQNNVTSPWNNSNLQGVEIQWKDLTVWKNFNNMAFMYKNGNMWQYTVSGSVIPPKPISIK